MKKDHKIRIALIDDHVLFREGLRDLLIAEPNFDVVAEGGDGTDALGFVSELPLDILLIDLRMPHLGGISTIRRIRETYPDLKIIVITMYEDEDHKREAILAGADAYHSKMDPVKLIVQTIRQLLNGKKMFSEAFVAELKNSNPDHEWTLGSGSTLTETEHKILEELQKGSSNLQLAIALAMSERTVKNHLTSIFKKLGATSRLDAVLKGMEKRLLPLSL